MKKSIFKPVICLHRKWVAFEVSRKYAEKEVKNFNTYYDNLPFSTQQDFYGGKKSSIKQYERCMLCGTCYHNFRRAKKNEIPLGSTLNPIISKKD
jgi:succinate dehydrogenase/fumarate reductase-like Fe-S protein